MEKIEAGQYWQMRSGKIVQIDKLESADPHSVKSGDKLSWQQNGRYWNDDYDHQKDLIRKVE
jgi:hypothetical protein